MDLGPGFIKIPKVVNTKGARNRKKGKELRNYFNQIVKSAKNERKN